MRGPAKQTIALVLLPALVSVIISGCAAAPAPAAPAESAPAAAVESTTALVASSDAAEFFKGKTMTLYTSGTAGSASDIWTRTIARYLGEQIGANIVTQNESAGNGRVIHNQMRSQIKADGLSLCFAPLGVLIPPFMTGDSAVEYDITKFAYIGAAESGNQIVSVQFDGPIKSVDDLKATKGLKFAHSSKTSTPAIANAIAIDLLGLDGMLITGFDGSTGKQLAVQQGDAHATVLAPDAAMLAKSKGVMSPLMQIGTARTSPGADLPVLMELVDANALTDTQKRLVGTLDVLWDAKSVFAPPGTPQERVDYLIAAFKAVYDNPNFTADMKTALGEAPGAYVSGQELSDRANAMVGKKDDVKLWDDLLAKYVK